MELRARLTAAACLAVLACTTEPSPDPAGCEDLFDEGALTCSDDEACAAVEATPSRLVRWQVQFREDLSGSGEPSDKISDYAHKAECAEAFITQRGATLISGPIDAEHFIVEATLEQLEPLCRASMIGHCSPYASDEDCFPHDEAACEADGLCRSFTGVPLDDAQTCRQPPAFARCFSKDTACSASEIVAQHEDGTCWHFVAECFTSLDTAWTEEPEPGACPDVGAAMSLPECG